MLTFVLGLSMITTKGTIITIGVYNLVILQSSYLDFYKDKYYQSTNTQDYERTDFDLMYNLQVFFATRNKIKHYD